MKKELKIVISGGGTGGHIYPAIAIANELQNRYPSAKFLFVGAKDRMEMEKVPKAGYEIKGLWISGIQRKISAKNLLFPFKLLHSLWNANKIISNFKPDVVIGTGGYASGPTLIMANRRNIGTLVQEQNSLPGITNKLLASKTKKICVAYDGLDRFFPQEKIIKTGNPVRQDILNTDNHREEAIEKYALDTTKKTLLIIGGSLGAGRINALISEHLPFFKENNLQLLWQCGSYYISTYEKCAGDTVQVFDFLYDMHLAYAAADIIISRSGAGSVSELCIVGKPVIFIPSPNVAEDHQTKNAEAIVSKDAALLLKESDFSNFETLFLSLLNSQEKQTLLGGNIKKLALPMATSDIVDQIEKIIK